MQHDYVIDNNTGLNVRADINNALAAIVSNNSGDTEPATMFPFQFWVDTTGATTILKMRNEANSAWVVLGDIAIASFGALLKSGGTMSGQLLARNSATLADLDFAFAGDADTGFFSSGANLLDLVAGGVSLLRLDGVLGYVKMLGTKGLQLPSGTVAERPTGVNGIIRYNNDNNVFEGFANSNWGSLGGYNGFAAITGSASFCTHATLAAALADVAVVAGSRILVTESETVATTNSVTKANMHIEFLPGVTLTQGAATTGIDIGAAGCRIKMGRFSGFTTNAINIQATFQNNFVTECRFASCTAEVTEADAAPNNVIANNITE